jgi:hypothetical protein
MLCRETPPPARWAAASAWAIGRLHEHLPGYEAFDEHGLERAKADEVLRKRFKIVTHCRIASGVRFKSVLVETGLGDPPCRR